MKNNKMVCGPGQISGPSSIPFWSTCYDIHSDMGQHLTAPGSFQAELSDPKYVWRQFGKPPKDQAGRERLGTSGPSLREQLQASLNALHPVLGKDEVASALFEQGQKMLSTLRVATPDSAALTAAMKNKIGDAAAHYAPEVMKQFYDEETKQKLLGYVAAITAPLAVKYGGLVRALNGAVAAGALAGASVLIAGIWNGWVQERLGEQMNELHSTSGTLADAAPGPPWQGYAPGDWVAMRELVQMAWVPRIGLVLDEGATADRKYKRYRVAVLPTGEIVGRGAADLALIDQQGMRRAETLDPKLRFWRAAMAVKNRAELTQGCKFRRRLMKVGNEGPTANSCAFERMVRPVPDGGFGPVRRRPGAAVGMHEALVPTPAPSAPDRWAPSSEEWDHQRLENEDRRLKAKRDELLKAKAAGTNVAAAWQKLLQARTQVDRDKFELWEKRATMEQRSERILEHRGLVRLETDKMVAFQGFRATKVTHRDEEGIYYYKTMMGGLHAIPKGDKIVDTRHEKVPDAWKQIVIVAPEVEEQEEQVGTDVLGPGWGTIAALILLVAGIVLLFV